MDLTHLRTFLAVHRAGSFTRAAAVLDVSQPSVTAQIRALEKQIGRQLFLRLPRGVTPTTVADDLARKLAPHLDALEEITARDVFGTSPERTLHLAGPPEITAQFVLPELSAMVTRGLRLRVTFGSGEELLDGLTAARHDMVVTDVRPRRNGVTATPLTDEEYVLVAAPGPASRLPPELLATGGPAALERMPIVAEAEDLPLVERYWASVFDAKPLVTAAVVVPDRRAVLACVQAGAGVCVLPRRLCAGALDDGTLIALVEPEVPPLQTYFLAVRTGALSRPHIGGPHAHLLARAARW